MREQEYRWCVGCGVLIDARLVFCSDACGDAYFKNAGWLRAQLPGASLAPASESSMVWSKVSRSNGFGNAWMPNLLSISWCSCNE